MAAAGPAVERRRIWSVSPLPMAALGVGLGVALALAVAAPGAPQTAWLAAGGALALSALAFARRAFLGHLALFTTCVALGGLHAHARLAAAEQTMLRGASQKRLVIATIDGPLRHSDRGVAAPARLTGVTASDSPSDTHLRAADLRVWLQMPHDGPVHELVPGDRLLARVALRGPRPRRTPGTFHERPLLARRGVAGVATVIGEPRLLHGSRGPASWRPFESESHAEPDAPSAERVRRALHGARARALDSLRAGGDDPASPSNAGRSRSASVAVPNPDTGIMPALALGQGSLVSDEVRETFGRSGLAHVLAVSGLHFGLVALAVLGALRACFARIGPVRRRLGARPAAALVALPVLWTYVELVGAPVSAVRAFVMASCLLLGLALRREGAPEISLAMAALAILIDDPLAMLSPAFQLSFSAVVGLLWTNRAWNPPLDRLLARLTGPAWVTAPIAWVARSLLATAGASVATTPLVWVHFGQIPLLGGIANVWVVPVVSFVLLPLALGAACLAMLRLPDLAVQLVDLGRWVERWLVTSVVHFDRAMPAICLDVLPQPSWVIALWTAVCVAILRAPLEWQRRVARGGIPDRRQRPDDVAKGAGSVDRVDRPRSRGRHPTHAPGAAEANRERWRVWRLPVGCVALVARLRSKWRGRLGSGRRRTTWLRSRVLGSWSALALAGGLVLAVWHGTGGPTPGADGELRVTFLSVGQGDATLVEFPDGSTMLIDAGGVPASSFDTGERIVVPAVRALGRERVDIVVLTHPDYDHMGGLPSTILALRPSEVWTNGDALDSGTWRAVLEATAEVGATHRVVDTNTAPLQRGGATMRVLWPAPDVSGLERNDLSIVLHVDLGSVSFLLPGDAEAAAEAAMLERGLVPRATVLKAGHHGSRSSSTGPFLDAVQPRWMVHSLGEANSFGFPHADVLERAGSRGIPHLRTDTEGTVVMRTRGRGLEIERFYER